MHALASDISTLQVGDDIEEREAFLEKNGQGNSDMADHPGNKVAVTLDGPYGGLKLDLNDYSSVLAVAGGSGVTFALGTIEDAIRCRVENITVVWVVRDMCEYISLFYSLLLNSATVEALAPTLRHLHGQAAKVGLAVTYNLYLSSPPSPLPSVPRSLPHGTSMDPFRPEVAQLVRSALSTTRSMDLESNDSAPISHALAVVACGPEGLVMEARHAVATLSIGERVTTRGVGFHGECYAL